MAKCNKCGKKGWFFKVNTNGRCDECERIELLHEEERKLQEIIAKTQTDISSAEKAYDALKEKREVLYKEIEAQARKDILSQLRNVVVEIEEKKKQLEGASEEHGQLQKTLALTANKLLRLQTLFKSMQHSVNRYFDQERLPKEILDDNLSRQAEELLSTTVILKLHLMDIRELRKLYSQNSRVIQQLLKKYQARYTTKANITIYKLMVIALEAELQNVLYDMRYSKLDKAINDIKNITTKYQTIATDGNQSISSTVTKFIGEIEYLFIQAIKIEYEYYIQKERIKEEQKALREQMRQEAAERKLLEEERKKIEQEEEKYINEIMNINEQLSATNDELKIKQLQERIEKIQAQLNDVEQKKEEITRLQKGKAGYIYVISNLGSFGDNIFKIGMTRRINPQERIDELGSASLPFNFDVHSFIFSNDAPQLEYNLHKQLHKKRVNKVNLRKEFFNTTLDELEDLVYSLEPTAEFNRTMAAHQYYQSMAVDEIPENVIIVDDDSDDEEEQDEALLAN